jgi:drug/metabolite transporter (DMT)-like permease
MFSGSILGISLSLLCAFLWAVAAMCWSSAGRRIGSFNICVLRCLLAALLLLLFLPLYLWRYPLPAPAAGMCVKLSELG